MILGHFRIFEKSTDLMNSKIVEVGQYEVYGPRELEYLIHMKFKVIYNRFWMILGHFRIFEKMSKNDPKMAKVEPPTPVKVVTPTIFEFSIIENL